MERIRLAIIGAGFVAQQCHLPAFSANTDFVITHVADPIEDLRQHIASKYFIPKQFSNHRSLLDSGGFDAVVVTLPRNQTLPVVQDCASTGTFILTEKPICLNSSCTSSLMSTCVSNGSHIMTGYMRQHDVSFKQFKTIINQLPGQEIQSVSATLHGGYSYANPLGTFKGISELTFRPEIQEIPKWIPEKYKSDYEQFVNLFSHITHLIDKLFERKLRTLYNCLNGAGEGVLLCESGEIPIVFNLMRGKQYKWNEVIDVYTKTTHYQLSLQPAFLRNVPGHILISSGESETKSVNIQPAWSWSFYEQTKAFSNFIRADGDHGIDLERALRQVSFAEDIFRDIISRA